MNILKLYFSWECSTKYHYLCITNKIFMTLCMKYFSKKTVGDNGFHMRLMRYCFSVVIFVLHSFSCRGFIYFFLFVLFFTHYCLNVVEIPLRSCFGTWVHKVFEHKLKLRRSSRYQGVHKTTDVEGDFRR